MSCTAEFEMAAGPTSSSGKHNTTLSRIPDGVNLRRYLSLCASYSSHESNAAKVVYYLRLLITFRAFDNDLLEIRNSLRFELRQTL